MSLLSWVSILLLITLLYSLIIVVTTAKKANSVSLWLLSIAIISYSGSNITFLIKGGSDILIRWFNFSSLVCLVSFLFAMIRESKPIFARFPSYLIYLPFITLLFFPLIVHQSVIVNLLLGTFEIGCATVSIMMYGINHIKNKDSSEHLMAAFVFLTAILFYWFTPLNVDTKTLITELLIVPGIILITKGIKKKSK